MKSPGLYWATLCSMLAHATFIMIFTFAIKQSELHLTAATYMVDLVEGVASRPVEPAPSVPATAPKIMEPEPTYEPVSKSTMSYATKKLKTMKDQKAAKDYASKRLQELEAKKRLEGIRQTAAFKADTEVKSGSPKAEQLIKGYNDKVGAILRNAWVFPEMNQMKNLSAVITVLIQPDGRITATRFERTSGNPIFDRSALRAIAKVKYVDPPPYGAPLEIGVIFSPENK